MKLIYKYLVGFYAKNGCESKTSNAVVTTEEPITCIEEVNDLQEQIKGTIGWPDCELAILGIFLMGVEHE